MKAYFKEIISARRKRENEEGFSLVELIIVIAIIGIIVAIAIPVYSGIQDRAQQKTLDASARNGLTMALVEHEKGLELPEIKDKVSQLDTSKITHIVEFTPDQDGYYVAAVVTETLQNGDLKYSLTSGKFSNKGSSGNEEIPDPEEEYVPPPIATVPTGLCPGFLPFDRYADGTELMHKNGEYVGHVPAGWILTDNIYGNLDFLVGNACDPEVGDWEISWSRVPNPRA